MCFGTVWPFWCWCAVKLLISSSSSSLGGSYFPGVFQVYLLYWWWSRILCRQKGLSTRRSASGPICNQYILVGNHIWGVEWHLTLEDHIWSGVTLKGQSEIVENDLKFIHAWWGTVWELTHNLSCFSLQQWVFHTSEVCSIPTAVVKEIASYMNLLFVVPHKWAPGRAQLVKFP